MFTKLLLAAAAVPVAAVGAALSADYAIVDVRDRSDGMHLVVPVPLSLARVALGFAPDSARQVDIPAAGEHLALARGVLQELRRAPDFELVRVEERDDLVVVRKAGDELVVDVSEARGAKVHVKLPLAGAARVLAAYDGQRLDARALIDVLREADGEVVRVVDADTEVSIRVW